MLEKKLHDWLNNEASEADIEALKADAENASYIKIAEVAKEFTVPEWNPNDHYANLQTRLQQEQHPKNRMRWIAGIAATIAIVAISYFFLATKDTAIRTQIAQKETITLPDESLVRLNAESSIRFNEKNWSSDRTLSLEGEAFFDVAKGKTFTVETPSGSVEVVGTEFNVHARATHFSVSCYEGLVRVIYADTIVSIPAGEAIQVVGGRLSTLNNKGNTAPSWLQDESSFEAASFAVVIAELQRQYPVQIQTLTIINKQFTGSFPHNNLEVALRSVCEPLGLSFDIDGEHVTIYAAAKQ